MLELGPDPTWARARQQGPPRSGIPPATRRESHGFPSRGRGRPSPRGRVLRHHHSRRWRSAASWVIWPWPPCPEVSEARRAVLGLWIPTIDAMLAEDDKAPRKQRHTAHRTDVRLVTEYAAKIVEPTVRVRERRRLLYGVAEVMVPQVHDAREEAEVDLSDCRRGLQLGAGDSEVISDARVQQRRCLPLADARGDPAGVPGGTRQSVRALRRCLWDDPTGQPELGMNGYRLVLAGGEPRLTRQEKVLET